MFDDFYDYSMNFGGYMNDQELKVNDLVDDYRYKSTSANNLTNEMYNRGIDYDMLPDYIKDRIDTIDCY